MDIIKFIANQEEPVSSKSIAKGVGAAIGTVMCHLVTLEDGGFVKQEENRYEPGLFLAVIWASVKRSLESKITKVQSELELIRRDEELEENQNEQC